MADSNVNIDSVHINFCMDKIYNDYPLTCLPKSLNKRTGKAKKCLFEQIDLNMYEKEARMITFHTSLDRIHLWIKTLDLFYFDHLGISSEYDINWSDEPAVWSDPNSSANSIKIEVLDKAGTLFYNVTFFVTTCTIRVQGSKYLHFVENHFPILQDILIKVHDNFGIISTPATVLTENVCDLESTIRACDSEDETSVKSIVSIKSVPEIVDFPNPNTLQSLEETIMNGLKKFENFQVDDTARIIEAIKTSGETCLHAIKQMKSVDKDVPVPSAKLNSLTEEVKLLESKLKIEKHKYEFATVQHKESLQHEKSLLEETRSQLRKMIESSNSEADFNIQQIKDKNVEIIQLQSSVQDLTCRLDKANDEILSLKLHMSTALDKNVGQLLQQESYGETSKPYVLLIGTSNVKGINESKLTQAAIVSKVVKYHLNETAEYIRSVTEIPDVIVLHSLTNDLTLMNPQECVDALENVLSLIQSKWNTVKIVISLTTPRSDSIGHHTNGQIINALVKQKVSNERSIFYCEHVNMLQNGNPNLDMLSEDKYHLSAKGTSFLASNLKKSLHEVLNIPMPNPRERSRSRARRGQGRGRNLNFR